MLITEPPQERYMCDSARVENCGPSVGKWLVNPRAFGLKAGNIPMQIMVPLSCSFTPSPAKAWPHFLTTWEIGKWWLHMFMSYVDYLCNLLIKGIRKTNMADYTLLEKGKRSDP